MTETSFTLHYVGTHTTAGQLPQFVFTLETFAGSPRYRTVVADAQYPAVDAAQGGVVAFTVAGRRIEPAERGQLTVEAAY